MSLSSTAGSSILLDEDIGIGGGKTNVIILDTSNINQNDLINILNDKNNSNIVLGWCFSEKSELALNAIRNILSK